MPDHTRAILALCAALALSSTALAHDHGAADAAGKPASAASGEPRAIRIVEKGDGTMNFSPDAITVKRGETVRFDVTNSGKLPHEFRIDTVAGNAEHKAMMAEMPDMKHEEGNTIAVAPGATGHLAWTFTRAGTFQFACLIPGHYEAGMRGTIKVER